MYGTVAVVDPDLIIPPNLGLTLSAMPDLQKDKMAQRYGGTGVMISDVLSDSDAARQGVGPGDIILRLPTKAVTTPEEVQAEIDAARNESLGYIAMLILPKVQNMPGPKWVGLQLGAPTH
jgi:S1-C subfamily serine protease